MSDIRRGKDSWFLRDRPHLDSDGAIRSYELSGIPPVIEFEGSEAPLTSYDAPLTFERYKAALEQRKSYNLKTGSLKLLAFLVGKDPKTVKRMCEQNQIPHAYKTGGGQWRIDYSKFATSDFFQVKRNISNHGRTKTDERGNIINRLNARAELIFETWAAKHPVLSQTKQIPPAEVKNLAVIEPENARLYVAVQNAKSRGKLFASEIAKQMGVSRATLYRKFGSKLIAGVKRKNSGAIDAELVVRPSDPPDVD